MKTLFTFRRFDRLKDYLQDKYSIVQPLKLERDIKNFLLFATGISLCILVSCQQTSSHTKEKMVGRQFSPYALFILVSNAIFFSTHDIAIALVDKHKGCF